MCLKNEYMTCCVRSAEKICYFQIIKKRISPEDYIIAADGGLLYAERLGVIPDCVLGDFDSLGYVPDCADEVYPSKKDDTDTMLAVREAIARGFTEATLCCALGGRLDHTLSNLQSLVFAREHGLSLRLVSADTEIYVLRNSRLTLPRREGFSLSVFSYSERSRGVCLRGVKYPLDDAELSSAFPLGVSNAWQDETADVSVAEGTLLIVLSQL